MNFNIWTAKISVAFKIIGFFLYMYTNSMWPKVLPHVKKIPILSTKTIFFPKIIVKSFLDIF